VNSSTMRTWPVLDHVVDVALEQRVRPEPLAHVVEHVHVDRVVEVRDPERLLGFSIPSSVSETVFAFSSMTKSASFSRRGMILSIAVIQVRRFLGRTADDEGVRASSMRIAVDLVDDAEVVAALLHVRFERVLHVVAEVVESVLVVGPVRDVAPVRRPAFRRRCSKCWISPTDRPSAR